MTGMPRVLHMFEAYNMLLALYAPSFDSAGILGRDSSVSSAREYYTIATSKTTGSSYKSTAMDTTLNGVVAREDIGEEVQTFVRVFWHICIRSLPGITRVVYSRVLYSYKKQITNTLYEYCTVCCTLRSHDVVCDATTPHTALSFVCYLLLVDSAPTKTAHIRIKHTVAWKCLAGGALVLPCGRD